MVGPLLVTLSHHGRELDLEVRCVGAATVGHFADEVIMSASLDRLPPNPSIAVERTGRTLARDAPMSRCDLRSGDRVRLSDAARATPETTDQVAAVVEVVEGPDAGRSIDLTEGLSDIGRGELCDVRLQDPTASRRHARVRVDSRVHVWDLGATNAVLVNGRRISETTEVSERDVVTVGTTKLHIRLHQPEGPRVVGSEVQFNRPPRVFKPFAGEEVKLPAPPEDPPRQYLPMIASVIPLIMGLVMWRVFGSLIFALFMLMSPLMMLGSFYESRKSGRKVHKKRLAEHDLLVNRAVEQLDGLREKEIESRHGEFPSVQDTAQFALQMTPRLWERHPDDDEFLVLRVGRAEQAARTAVTIHTGGSRRMRDELEKIPPRYTRIPDLPAVAALPEVGGLGVAGPADAARALVRSLMVQLAGVHAPTEVAMAALLASEDATQWRWLAWLPHVQNEDSRVARSHFGHDARTCALLFAGLTDELDRRLSAREARDSQQPVRFFAVVTLIHERAPVERSRLTPLLEQGPAVGMHFIWVGASRRDLPRACGALVDLRTQAEAGATLALRSSGEEILDVEVETLDVTQAESVARTLAPVVEMGGQFAASTQIPTLVSLVDLLGGVVTMNEPRAIIERWAGAETALREFGRLRMNAAVGRGTEHPVEIDLRADGPHALVAGTTGAGKSELLQSLVASLAATHSPIRVTFLLVDYKGGAAFKECVGLPHTVGLVTDLNTSEVRRALVSLEAELRHRERVLNEANAKDLFELEALGRPGTPPSLVLVVDEFAALAREVPEFIDGVVDVALRGRSLGIHLVLATQRPAGVITPQIRANTNLRIALRVADVEDSVDVIGTKSAALLPGDRPGRAYARIGAREPQLLQSAWAGGVTRAVSDDPAVTLARRVFDQAIPLHLAEPATPALRVGPSAEADGADAEPDLRRLVENIAMAARATGIEEPRRPWHPPLKTVYDLADLHHSPTDAELVIGMADLPRDQRQELARFLPDIQGSLLVLGASGSGKTVLLRSLTVAAALVDSGPVPHVYGLDFSGRGLEMLEVLPHVGSIVRGDDHTRVVRLLRDLRSRINDRGEKFSDARAGSLPEYRSSPLGDLNEPRILVLLDGYAAFHSAYERVEAGRWVDELTQLVADGRQFGIHFVLTADRRSAFPLALAGTVGGRLVLRLSSEEEYASAGVAKDILTGDSPAGRAVLDGVEIQVGLLGGDPRGRAQSAALAGLADATASRIASPAPPVRVLPTVLPANPDESTETEFAIGMRESDLAPALVQFESGAFLVAGPPRCGKTTALDTLVATAPRCVARIVVISPRASFLTEPRPRVRAAVGNAQAAEILTALTEDPMEPTLVVVDDMDSLADTEADRLLTAILRDGANPGPMVAVSAGADAARRAYEGVLRSVRGFKSGVLLQPDTDVDGDLLGVRLPRVANTAWPSGRGYLVSLGAAGICHLAQRQRDP